MDRQANSCLPKLPQWLDWPGPNPHSQLLHCKQVQCQIPMQGKPNPTDQHTKWYAGCPRLQFSPMLQVSGLGPHGKRMCNSCNTVKQGRGDPGECSQTPLQSCTVKSKHSLCNPKPKLTQDKADNQKGQKGITPIPFLNPNQ